MIFEVNNGRRIKVFQARDDGPVYLVTYDGNVKRESTDSIKPGDCVTMLNWYRYQKEQGNDSLTF